MFLKELSWAWASRTRASISQGIISSPSTTSTKTLLYDFKYSFSSLLDLKTFKAPTRAVASAWIVDKAWIFFANPSSSTPKEPRRTPAINPSKLPATKEPSTLIFRALFFGGIQAGCGVSSLGLFCWKIPSFRAFQIAQRINAISSKEGEIRSRDRAEKCVPPFLFSCCRKGRGLL